MHLGAGGRHGEGHLEEDSMDVRAGLTKKQVWGR